MGIGRPAPRVSGRTKMTVTTRHDVGGYEIARLLCRYGSQWQPNVLDGRADQDRGQAMSLAQVRATVLGWIEEFGRSAYLSEDLLPHLSPAQFERVVVWAVAQVTRLYPTLVDQALTDFLADATQGRRDYEATLARYAQGA